jgi:decaprenyl-phosphate phosphoribosyltransferase
MLLPLLRAARPHQWVKNLFVAAPVVFSRRMDEPAALVNSGLAVLAFCLLSSAVYLLNDIVDVEKDRAHPLKRFRPIASGALPVVSARAAAGLAALAGLLIGAALGPLVAVTAAAYLGLNLAYSFRLKHVPFVDVGCISAGFLLRVVGGALAIPVSPSGWLLLCTGLLASFLGFGKRAHELRVAGIRGGNQREVLEKYHPSVLRALLFGLAVATLATYTAYTQSAHAQMFFGTRALFVTLPFVAFGLGRFLWLSSRKLDAESPTDSMLKDRPFLVNLVLYAGSLLAVIYGGA